MENLVKSLFEYQRIKTTITKAKAAQRLAEKMITMGKLGTLHARRRVFAALGSRSVVMKLFNEIAPRFKNYHGGYTRVLHLGTRKGDAAPMAVLELMEKEVIEKKVHPKREKEMPKHAAAKEASREKKTDGHAPETPHVEKHPSKEHVKKETHPKGGFLRNIGMFFRKKGGE